MYVCHLFKVPCPHMDVDACGSVALQPAGAKGAGEVWKCLLCMIGTNAAGGTKRHKTSTLMSSTRLQTIRSNYPT